jgi:5-methylcytosine-specific restriction endonuclease McrA
MPRKDKKAHSRYCAEKCKQKRQFWLDVNGPCVRCGSSVDLEVDHINPSEKDDHKIWSWTPVRRDAELVKCQVLCHKCHAEKTRGDGSHGETNHGKLGMYQKNGCRCLRCCLAKSEEKSHYDYRVKMKKIAA